MGAHLTGSFTRWCNFIKTVNSHMKSKAWCWVTLKYATYRIEVQAGKVVFAAPIAKWMIGKDYRYCKSWIMAKGGIIKEFNLQELEGSLTRPESTLGPPTA